MIKNNQFCEFMDIGLDDYQCIKCGLIVSSYEGVPLMVCSSVDHEDILELQKTGQGCSLEQVEKRFSICKTCEFFQDNSCNKCGCRIVRNIEFKNKLLWKTEQCPIGKWGVES